MTKDPRQFVTRAITIPILKPVEGTWDELREALNEAWKNSTVCANAMISALYARDFAAKAGRDDIPVPPRNQELNLYRIGTRLVPDMPVDSVSALDRMVRKRYKARNSKGQRTRWAAMVGAQSLPSFRFPTPYPCRGQSWKPELGRGGEAIVHVTLPPKRRWALVLKTGKGHRRQYENFKKIVSGELKRRELKIVAKGAKQTPMVAIVCDLPVKHRERSGDLLVYTLDDSLLVATFRNASEPSWYQHCLQVRRWVAEHRERIAKFADDRKHERRIRRSSVQDRLDAWCSKHRNRVDWLIKTVAASLAGFADRRGVARVIYDDSQRGFLPKFAYAEMATAVQNKLAECGIEYVTAGELRQQAEAKKAAKKVKDEWLVIQAKLNALRGKETQGDDSGND